MSDAPEPKKKKSRSPSFPAIDLEEAIEKIKIIWEKEKRHGAGVPVLAKHFGYSEKSSGGMQAVAALIKYGLAEEEGSNANRTVKLSERAMTILFGEPEKQAQARRDAALEPTLHRELWEEFGNELPSDDTLERKLILESDFNPASVKSAVRIFKKAIEIAGPKKNDTLSQATPKDPLVNESEKQVAPPPKPPILPGKEQRGPDSGGQKNMLAEYIVPLGSNEATLVFKGALLTVDDFDSLIEYVQLFKKQFERKQKAEGQFQPRKATWKNSTSDKPVTIVGVMGEKNGETFFKSDDGTGIPASQLTFD